MLLSQELAYIQDYVDLQREAVGDRGEIAFAIEGSPESLQIGPLVLVAFIENCFKHGLDAVKGVAVDIRLSIQGDTLLLLAENNLPDRRRACEPRGTGGLGLANVRRRLALQYAGKHHLEAGERDGRHRVSLRLDLA